MGSLFLSKKGHALNIQDIYQVAFPRTLQNELILTKKNKQAQKNANFIFEDVVVPMLGEQWENE